MNFLLPIILLTGSLTLAMVGSRPVQQNKRFDKTFKTLMNMVLGGEIQRAMPLYMDAAKEAKAEGYSNYQIKFLSDLSNCQFALYHFRDAIQTMGVARTLAKKIDDRRYLAKIDSNMSSLLWQMGNLDEAANIAEEGVRYADALEPANQSLLYSHLGVILADQNHLDKAEAQFSRAIGLAQSIRNESAEAAAWDSLAKSRARAERYPDAETAVLKSLALRIRLDGENIANSWMVLGTVRAGRQDYGSAIRCLNEAESALAKARNTTPPWLVFMQRGEIRMREGEYAFALKDMREALAYAREWRVDVPPNDASRTSSEARLAELYQSLVEAGNQLYLQTHDPALVRETFEAAEENRASSLRALLPHENDWRKNLSSHYYELLLKLQSMQAAQMRSGEAAPSAALLKLRADLSEIEAQAGGAQPYRDRRALDQAQGMLDDQSVLFSFELGDRISWVWAVTRDEITLHPLPPGKQLASSIVDFQKAVVSNGLDVGRKGSELYQCLFGSLETRVRAKTRWLLTLDGQLFDLPFPALTNENGKFLIQDHSLQIVPGALMLRAGGYRLSSQGSFLAVGDPIYNMADPRAHEAGLSRWLTAFSSVSDEKQPALARLWGTAREVEASARAWNGPSITILTGKNVSPENFWSKVQAKPDIIHIATHILEENEKPQTEWIAFSLGGRGKLQYVTPEDILAKSVSARLVVLSGCSSGKADIRPATGLMGLTRAWLAAGAGSVMATRWPTVDDDGAFFEIFYRTLRQSNQMNPAAALRTASIAMLNSGTWRAKPSLWSGYFLIGNY